MRVGESYKNEDFSTCHTDLEEKMIETKISQLASDIAILQNYINLNKSIGFNNSARLLEVIAIKFFQFTDIANLKNMNQIKVNYPSIDAADNIEKIAVQTTSVADTRKVNETLAAFTKKNDKGKCLGDYYKELYIFGFCKASKVKNVPEFCKVVGPAFFLEKILELNDELKVQSLIDAIRQHSEYSSIHPYSDIDCLQVILRVISRNAIKHRMYCEGSLSDMTRGLNEISELIGKGAIGESKMSKPMHAFKDSRISDFLIHTLDKIGRISGIINSAALPKFDIVCLDFDKLSAIDALKQEISLSAMEIARIYDLDIPLAMHD